VIPVWIFAFFSVASLGLYELYRSYKSWKFFKEKDNLDISPFWRTFLIDIFLWPLFNKYSDMLKGEGYNIWYPASPLAIFWIGMNLISRFENPIGLISYLSFLAFIPVPGSVDEYWENKFPGFPEKPLTRWQLLLLIIGTIVVFLDVVGIFIPE